jgi:hypothetical protein
MIDHRDDSGINFYLTTEEREYYMDVILRVYPSGTIFKTGLKHTKDSVLMAFAQRLINDGKVKIGKPSITTRAIKYFIGATTYIVDEFYPSIVVYFGQRIKQDTIQTAVVYLDKNNVITEAWIMGERQRRYEGMELIIL